MRVPKTGKNSEGRIHRFQDATHRYLKRRWKSGNAFEMVHEAQEEGPVFPPSLTEIFEQKYGTGSLQRPTVQPSCHDYIWCGRREWPASLPRGSTGGANRTLRRLADNFDSHATISVVAFSAKSQVPICFPGASGTDLQLCIVVPWT